MSSADEQEFPPTQPPPGKKLKLKDGSLAVRYIGYKNRGDTEMIMEIEFIFDKEPSNPRIVGKYRYFNLDISALSM